MKKRIHTNFKKPGAIFPYPLFSGIMNLKKNGKNLSEIMIQLHLIYYM